MRSENLSLKAELRSLNRSRRLETRSRGELGVVKPVSGVLSSFSRGGEVVEVKGSLVGTVNLGILGVVDRSSENKEKIRKWTLNSGKNWHKRTKTKLSH